MDRNKIKIFEFGNDTQHPESSVPADRSSNRWSSSLAGKNIKIKEFESPSGGAEQYVAKPEDIGGIKIVEFDNEPLPQGEKVKHNQGTSALKVPTPEQINVFEYDDQGKQVNRKQEEARHNGIKIIEF